MKKIIPVILLLIVVCSCNNKTGKGSFTVNGEIKNIANQKIYLEQLFFNQEAPEILDSAEIKNGKFQLKATAPEEGLYRLRTSNEAGFIFINDQDKINFKADNNDLAFNKQIFNTPSNASMRYFFGQTDVLIKELREQKNGLEKLKESGISETDSGFNVASKMVKSLQEKLTLYCYKYADTVKSPVLGILAVTSAPVPLEKFILPLQKLQKRFPESQIIVSTISFLQQKIAGVNTPPKEGQQGLTIGSTAPELTMPDTSGKMFSLSSLRGKYVLVDFWASWCGPCRGENPNVVRAYNTFRNKNFTVLGVSLDKDQKNWLKAIHDDNLTWYHISDLQYWNSAAVPLYGLDGIPFNVLVDPQGKILATGLREEALQQKLAEVLK